MLTRRGMLASLAVALTARAARAGCVSGSSEYFDAEARRMREVAVAAGDQAYGAVVVLDGCVVGFGPSRVVVDNNADAHAERVALWDAQKRLGRSDLAGAQIHSTSRPCAICQAALAEAGVARMHFVGGTQDAVNAMGETALLIAVREGRTEAARAMIAAGADINAQAKNQDTPWLLAGALGRAEILRAMIPAGPDFAIRNRYGGNALIPACERAHVEAIKVLLGTRIDVNHVNNLGWTCLLEVAILGDGGPRHQEAARLVLAAGADPNLADGNGATALAHARAAGHGALAEIIAGFGGK